MACKLALSSVDIEAEVVRHKACGANIAQYTGGDHLRNDVAAAVAPVTSGCGAGIEITLTSPESGFAQCDGNTPIDRPSCPLFQ